MSDRIPSRRILLTGATGYVGGRLLGLLAKRGERVRCLVRRPAEFGSRVDSSIEIAGGDIRDPGAVTKALREVDAAYYLVHSMGAGSAFGAQDRRAAEVFAAAAKANGVSRIVYLGGLGREPGLSHHLASRQEVGRILRESGVPTLEFRASIILGSGSVSFEIIRCLVDRLPVMVTPRWTRVRTQPIAIEDVLAYLTAALDVAFDRSRIVEIGGPDVVSYGDLMREYGRQRGLMRVILPVPVLTPRLSSLWLGLVTTVYARVGKELVDGLRNETIVEDESALEVFPGIMARGVAAAIERALQLEDEQFAETRWSDALSSAGLRTSWGGMAYGRRLIDSRSVEVPSPPERAFAPIMRIGGEVGWYHADSLWRLRGFVDLLVGGVGMRRGRPHPERLRVGDPVDFWRVEALEPNHLLRLVAEMKVPGRAWLQYEVEGTAGESVIRQTAIFDPAGIAGQVYWYLLYPAHGYVFAGMLRAIARAATAPPCPPAPAGV